MKGRCKRQEPSNRESPGGGKESALLESSRKLVCWSRKGRWVRAMVLYKFEDIIEIVLD